MNKVWITLLALLGAATSISAFEKLEPEYLVRYGSPDAPCQIVEYVSLSCGKCMELIEKELPEVIEKYIDTNEASLIYHPLPADLQTLQMMVCFELLDENEKPLFLNALGKGLLQTKGKQGCKMMQLAMEGLEKPLPDLDKIEFLEKTQAFQSAYRFLKQEDVIKIIPTIELDGVLVEESPTMELLDEYITKKRMS